jgi:predicted nuclease of predicted toxin-antitoxin system
MTRLLVDMNLSVEWISLLTAAGPSVLQVRCLNVLPEAIGPLALELLRAYANEIEKGHWWLLTNAVNRCESCRSVLPELPARR